MGGQGVPSALLSQLSTYGPAIDWQPLAGQQLPSSPTFVSGTAQQLSTVQDVMLYIDVKTAASLSIALGPDSSTSTTLQSSVTEALGLTSVRVPAGWYVKLTGTMSDLAVVTVPV